MRKTLKTGDNVTTIFGDESTITDIKNGIYLIEGYDYKFRAGELILVPDPPKEIKKTPLKIKSPGARLKQPKQDQDRDDNEEPTETAPGQKPIQKKLHQIRQVSKKLARDQAKYRKQAEKYLETHTECAVKTKNCTLVAEEVHHKAGRGAQLLNETKWLPVCTSCHIWITEHSKQAIELCFSERRNV